MAARNQALPSPNDITISLHAKVRIDQRVATAICERGGDPERWITAVVADASARGGLTRTAPEWMRERKVRARRLPASSKVRYARCRLGIDDLVIVVARTRRTGGQERLTIVTVISRAASQPRGERLRRLLPPSPDHVGIAPTATNRPRWASRQPLVAAA